MTFDLINIVFIIIAVLINIVFMYYSCILWMHWLCIPAVYWGCNDHVFIPCSLFSYVKKFVSRHITFDLINVVL